MSNSVPSTCLGSEEIPVEHEIKIEKQFSCSLNGENIEPLGVFKPSTLKGSKMRVF